MRIEHQIGATWAEHIERMKQEIAAHEARAFEFEGRAVAERREAETKRRHAGQLLDLIASAEKLPASKTAYRLSADGTKLIGDVEVPPDGMAS